MTPEITLQTMSEADVALELRKRILECIYWEAVAEETNPNFLSTATVALTLVINDLATMDDAVRRFVVASLAQEQTA